MGTAEATIEILYENQHMAVVRKPVGVLSQGGEQDLVAILSRQLDCSVYPVHRLDRGVGGVMVFAKTAQEAARLSAVIQRGELIKEYLCVVHGCPEALEGQLRDLLFHDRTKNKTYVVSRSRRGVREAVLDYRVLESRDGYSLIAVCLHTGRTHQIRVQFASRGTPLAGDGKYGGRGNGGNIALWCFRLTIPGFGAAEPQCFSLLPPQEAPWDRFSAEALQRV